MEIKDLAGLYSGDRVHIRVMIQDKKILQKRNNEDFLSLDIQDHTGKLNFPVWSDVELLDNTLEIGQIIDIDGNIGFWEGVVQLKNTRFHVLDENEMSEVNMSDFVPSYDIPDELIKEFEEIVDNLKTPYRAIAICATGALGYNNKRWEDFTTCVSAENHHGNKRGGLFLHTYGVLRAINNLLNDYIGNPYFYNAADVINADRLRLKAILHDIEKINEYEYTTVIRRKPDKKTGHIYDGVVKLHKLNAETGYILTDEDIEDISYSILSHHGKWSPEEPKSLEDWLLHLADMIDSRIVGSIEKK